VCKVFQVEMDVLEQMVVMVVMELLAPKDLEEIRVF
jgi:hypothetical protein